MHKLVVGAMETERIRISGRSEPERGERAKVSQIIENLLQREQSLALSRAQREQFTASSSMRFSASVLCSRCCATPPSTRSWSTRSIKSISSKKGQLVLCRCAFAATSRSCRSSSASSRPSAAASTNPFARRRPPEGRLARQRDHRAAGGLRPTLTIRRFSAKPFTHKQLVGFGACTRDLSTFCAPLSSSRRTS